MQYKDIAKLVDITTTIEKSFIAKNQPKNCIEALISGEILNVPMPNPLVNDPKKLHGEIRVVVFDMVHKVYLSNFLIINARLQPT